MAMTAWTERTPIEEARYLYDNWHIARHWNVRNDYLDEDVVIDCEDSFPFLKAALICRLIDERKT